MELTARLKAHTAGLHTEVEDLLYAEPLMQRTIAKAQLVHLLRIHHRFHVMLERWIAQHEEQIAGLPIRLLQRSQMIMEDLRSIGAEAPDEITIEGTPGFEELLGVLYVSEGSMLGGAVIAKALSGHPELQGIAWKFFGAYGQDLRSHWIALCAMLNERPTGDHERILNGAVIGFDAYKKCFHALSIDRVSVE